MDGRCFLCTSKFTLFNKEYDCVKCKHSICKKCFVETTLKSLGPNKVRVCKDCQAKEQNQSPDDYLDPPKFLQKLDDPPPYPGPSNPKPKLTKQLTDDDIQARLNALKNNKKRTLGKQMSEYELQKKVNKLMGKPPPVREPVIQMYVAVKSQSEQVDDLVNQVDNECKLEDSAPKSTGYEDLEARARALKSTTPSVLNKKKTSAAGVEGLRDISNLPEIEQVEYILKQAQEEAMLDIRAGYQGNIEDRSCSPEEDVKLPWCCVCNNDAEVECPQCDNDLYCKRCYREGHTEFGLDDHDPQPFKKTEKQRKMELEM